MSHLLNVQEVAIRLGIKPATVRAWILRRKIEFVRVGRAIRIKAEVIDQFVANNTIPSREQR